MQCLDETRPEPKAGAQASDWIAAKPNGQSQIKQAIVWIYHDSPQQIAIRGQTIQTFIAGERQFKRSLHVFSYKIGIKTIRVCERLDFVVKDFGEIFSTSCDLHMQLCVIQRS